MANDERSGDFVVVEGLKRAFDVSKPLINRVLERAPRQFLKAVDGVSFTIQKGETFALVGESGSGKSTLARMVAGLLPPDAGSVVIDGISMSEVEQDAFTWNRIPLSSSSFRMLFSDKPASTLSQHAFKGSAARQALRKRIQMIFQDPYASLNPRWRVGRIIAEPINAFGLLQGAAVEARVGALLALVGLHKEDGAKFPHEFSGGQRQRIAIARALAAHAAFIICDEPTSALDVSVQAQILNLMRDVQAEFGLTYLFISHNLAVVRHMASRIGVMYLGRIVEISEGKALFSNPRHPYTRMLLDAVPDLELSGRARQMVAGEIPNPITPPMGCSFHPRCPLAMPRCRAEAPVMLGGVACHVVNAG